MIYRTQSEILAMTPDQLLAYALEVEQALRDRLATDWPDTPPIRPLYELEAEYEARVADDARVGIYYDEEEAA